MSKHHVRAVFTQFPWLTTPFGAVQSSLRDASVSRFGVDIFFDANNTTGGNDESGSKTRTTYYLFDKCGHALEMRRNFFERLRSYFSREKTIKDRLENLGLRAFDCEYIVKIVDRYELTLYRRKQGYTIYDMFGVIEESVRATAERAQQEIAMATASQ